MNLCIWLSKFQNRGGGNELGYARQRVMRDFERSLAIILLNLCVMILCMGNVLKRSELVDNLWYGSVVQWMGIGRYTCSKLKLVCHSKPMGCNRSKSLTTCLWCDLSGILNSNFFNYVVWQKRGFRFWLSRWAKINNGTSDFRHSTFQRYGFQNVRAVNCFY